MPASTVDVMLPYAATMLDTPPPGTHTYIVEGFRSGSATVSGSVLRAERTELRR